MAYNLGAAQIVALIVTLTSVNKLNIQADNLLTEVNVTITI